MNRRIKIVGLLAVSILTMSAIAASSAQATEVKFTAAQYPATIEGQTKGDIKLKIGPKEVTCNVEHSKSTAINDSEEITVQASFTECTIDNKPATVTMNGCDWIWHADKKMDIQMPGG